MPSYRRINGYSRGKPIAAWWREQVRNGIKYRKESAYEEKWSRWRNYYRNKYDSNTVLPVNVFFRMMRTIIPRIYFRNPSLSVQATKPGIEQQLFAQLIERIDNKLIRTMDVKNQMKKMIQYTWMFGTSAGKLGFGAQYTPTPDLNATESPDIIGTNFKRRVEYNQLIQPNMPWFMAVHPGTLVVPAKLANWEATPWVATVIRRDLNDLKADPRYDNTNSLRAGIGMDTGKYNKDEIDLYEIRDMRTGRVIVVSAYGEDEVLLDEEDHLQNNNRPNIYPLIFNPDDEIFWGIPDSCILEPQQLELNETRALQMKHRRISIIKMLYKRGSIEVAELDRLLNGDVGLGIPIEKNGEMTDVSPIEIGHIPEGLIMGDQIIQQDIRDSMGFSRNQSGDYASQKSHNAPTAYEAQVVQAASEIRVDERRDICADILVDVFEDTNVLIFDEWEAEEIVQVMGPDSIPVWVKFKPVMLKGARYEIEIDPDSTVPETKDIRRQKATESYTILKENPLIDPMLLTKFFLRERHGVESYDSLLKQMQQNAAQGVPGSTPENAMPPEMLMQQMLAAGGTPPGQG